MNPYQEKAREIVIKMQFQKEPLTFEQAKICGLILVDEIINDRNMLNDALFYSEDYWLNVKKEMELL